MSEEVLGNELVVEESGQLSGEDKAAPEDSAKCLCSSGFSDLELTDSNELMGTILGAAVSALGLFLVAASTSGIVTIVTGYVIFFVGMAIVSLL